MLGFVTLCVSVMVLMHSAWAAHATTNLLWLQLTSRQTSPKSGMLNWTPESRSILEQVYMFAPDNVNVLRLLGYANSGVGNDERAIEYWRAVPGIELELARHADILWNQGKNSEATSWYTRAIAVTDVPPYQYLFRCLVAAINSNIPIPEPCKTADLNAVRSSRNRAKINGSELRWLDGFPEYGISTGDRLVPSSLQSLDSGVMWWSGTALAIINSSYTHPTKFTVLVRALNSDIAFNIVHNGEIAATFQAYSNKTSAYSVQFRVNEGLNTVGVELPVDAGDLIVYSLEIE